MKRTILIVIILLAALLRLYKLGSVPPSLYWDEASLGYNAYSILKTAKDEHGKFLPITNFAAYGDYKPPLYIYATVPSIAIFGLNEFAIRFPSAFFGILTVLLSYLLTRKIFNHNALGDASGGPPPSAHSGQEDFFSNVKVWEKRGRRAGEARGRTQSNLSEDKAEIIALLAAFFLAISPWHLQLSRGAFEGNMALFFSTLGVYLFLKFVTDKPMYIFFSFLSYLAAIYTFTGQRLFVPFIAILLIVLFRNEIIKNSKIVIVSAIISFILFWPLLIFATQTLEGRLRFEEVTMFKDLEPIDRARNYQKWDNFSSLSSLIHNRRLIYTREYLINYFDAFNPSFLFTKGDYNPRFSTQEVGQLYIVDLLIVLAGIYFLFVKRQKYSLLLIGWLLISPLGPATARETPHALRMVHILPTFQIIAAFGFYSLYQFIKAKRLFVLIIFSLLIIQFLFYLHMYYYHWSKNFAGEWQFGYKQAIEAVKPLYNNYDQIVVSTHLGRPYIYFLLFNKYDPQKFQENSDVEKDQFYFIEVNGFDKYKFVADPDQANLPGKKLFIMPPARAPKDARKLETIKLPNGSTVFEISEFIPKE